MLKRLISLLLIVALGVGVYMYSRRDASARVKATLLEGIALMELSPDDDAYVRQQVEAIHPAAFDRALTATAREGGKFDARLYFDEIKRSVIERVSQDGRSELAAVLREEFEQLQFDVEER